MSFGYFILTILVIVALCGIICLCKWLLKNIDAITKPKRRRGAEIFTKVILVFSYCLLAFNIFEFVLILIAPLLEHLNTAFSAAIDRVFAFLDNLVPYAVLVGIAVAWWKNRHTSKHEGEGVADPVDVEYAAQEAEELHEDMGELLLNAAVATSENTPIQRPRDTLGIETGRSMPYRMDGDMAIHQFAVDVPAPLTTSEQDLVTRELQRHTNQYGKHYPHLCRDGRPPIVFPVKNGGNFVIVEMVLYSNKHKDKIKARCCAHIAKRHQTGDTYDRDF